MVPAEWTARVAELIPEAELIELPKTGHTIGPKAATRLTALLVPFLVEHEEGEIEHEQEAIG
jgi:hypothetical protein